MSFGVVFTDSEGGSLELEGSWRIAGSPPRLIGEGIAIELPQSIFKLDPTLTPDELDEIRRQVESAKK